MIDRWVAEREAFKSLELLVEQVERCRLAYERAELALPEPLKRLLGVIESQPQPNRMKVTVPALPHKSPPGAGQDWISIALSNCTPTTLVLAILRAADGPMRAKEVVDRVRAYLPDVVPGSIANIGSRLENDEQRINRSEDGWALLERETAPLLYEGRLWGPENVFQRTEVASHRRDAILHLLTFFKGGLQVLQILEQLQSCSWLHAPLTKDLLKEDMIVLSDDKRVRRRGESRKWELMPEKGDP